MDPIAYLYRKMIGDHWFEIAENPQSFDECDQYLDAKLKSIPEGKSFIFLANPHYYKGHTRPLQPINVMKSPALIGYVRAMTDIKTVIMGGDVVERGANRYLGLQEILCYANEMRSVCGKDFLVVHGNHDLNTPNVSTEDAPSYMITCEESEKALFSHIDRNCEDVSAKLAGIECTEEQKKEFLCYSRLHYYVDDENLKLRYIILDTGNPGFGRNGCVEELSDTAVVVNTVQTDCIRCQSRREGVPNHPMTRGTNTEQCFEIVTICPDGSIRLTRIGAGDDRTVNVR